MSLTDPVSAATYFPKRPQGATMHTVTGVLTWYGRGNDSGAIVVRDPGGVEADVYMAPLVWINGVIVNCSHPGLADCTDWPTNIVVGTTVVTVSYWIDPVGFDGRVCWVSDQIDVGTQPSTKKRKR
jgi:hypothetical protein